MTKRALIAEPDMDEALRQAAILKDDGYDTHVFTGADLVSTVEQSPPDVVVLRHERPGAQTGLALVARLKTVAPATAIVLTTSELTPEAIDKNKKQRVHADWYLRLPADRGELVGAARSVPHPPEVTDGASDERAKARDPSRPPPLPPQPLRALGQVPRPAPRVGEPVLTAEDLTFIEKVFSSIQHVDVDAPVQEPTPSAIGDVPDRKLALLRTKLKERERDLARLSRLWRAREEDLRQQETRVQQKDIEIEGLRLRIRDVTGELEAAQQTFVEKEAEWGRQMGETYEQHSLNEAELIQTVASKEDELNRLKLAMRKAEQDSVAERNDFTQRILEWERAYADFENHHWKVVAASVDEVQRLEDQVRQRESDKRQLKVELRERDNALMDLHVQRGALEEQTRELEHEAAVAVERNFAVTQGALALERRKGRDTANELAEVRAALLLVEEDLRRHQVVLGRVVTTHRDDIARLGQVIREGDAERHRLAGERELFRRRAVELDAALAETSALAEATVAMLFSLEEKRAVVGREQVRVRDDKLADLRDHAARVEQSLSDVTARLGQSEMDLAAESAHAEALQHELAELRTHAASTETRLQGALDGMTGERDRLAERLGATEGELGTTRDELAAEKTSRQQREAEIAGVLERKEGELADREKRIAELDRALGDAREDITHLRKTVSTRDERITELLNRVRQADEKQVQLEAQVFRLETTNAEREATIVARDERIEQLTANVERQTARGDQLDAELRKANATILDRQAQVERLDAHLADVQKQLASAREETATTRAELSTRSTELFEAERRASGLQAELQNARTEIEAGAAIVEQLEGQVRSLETRGADLRRQLEETDAKLRATLFDLDAAGERVEQLRDELTGARETIVARDAEIVEQSRAIREGERSREELQATLETARAEHARAIGDSERVREQLQAAFDAARAVHAEQLQAADNEKMELEEQLAQLLSENGALSSSLAGAAGRIEDLQARARQLEAAVAERTESLAASEQSLADAVQSANERRERLGERERELAEVRQALEEARSATEERGRWLATREAAIADLKAQVEAEKKSRMALDSTAKATETEFARARQELAEVTGALQDREERLATLMASTTTDLTRAREAGERAAAEVEGLRRDLAARDAELQRTRPAEARLAEVQKVEAHTRAEYQKLRAHAERLLQEHKTARALLEKNESERKAGAAELERVRSERDQARAQEAAGTTLVGQLQTDLAARSKDVLDLRVQVQRLQQAGQAAQKARADAEAELERARAQAEERQAAAMDSQAAELTRLQKELADARKAQRDAQMQAQQARAEAEQIKRMAAQRIAQTRSASTLPTMAVQPSGLPAPSAAAVTGPPTAVARTAPTPVIADTEDVEPTVVVSNMKIPAAARGSGD
jgi:chromosome segregation ATPase